MAGGISFSGHTEELSAACSTAVLMLLTTVPAELQALQESNKGDKVPMSVIPLTTHVPLGHVPTKLQALDSKSIAELLLAQKTRLGIDESMPIAVLGMHPHAGEEGKMGSEDETWTRPFVKMLNDSGLPAVGPLPADGFFGRHAWKAHSVVLGMYHDQVLIPFKMYAGTAGINTTLGLPFLRVSPDHGPAYEAAGKGLADAASMQCCLDYIGEWFANG